MEIIGREIEFGVATEATRGTAETTADKWVRKATANVVERATHAVDETTRGRLEDGEGRRVVMLDIEGSVEGILHIDLLGWFLANIYGVCVTTTVTGSVKSHAFTLGQNIQHPSLSLFAKDGSVQQSVFNNGMINTLEINAAIGDYVRYTAAFYASAAAANSDTPSYDTEYDFVAKDIVVKMAATEGGLAGATAIKGKDLTIKWDAGLIRDHVEGSQVADDIYNGKMMIEGTITLNFADETYKDLYLGDTSKYMSIVLTGDTDIGSGNFPTISLVLNKVQIMDWNRAGNASELVTQTIQWRAFINASDLEQSACTLKNLTASYTNVPSA